MFKYLFVGGHFGDNPKPSGYIKKLFSFLISINPNGALINGGKFEELKNLLLRLQPSSFTPYFDVIFWMPDISNEKEKLVAQIKKIEPYTLLVTSKNNFENKYKFIDMVARSLQVKANLSVEFTKEDTFITGTVFDPLGNYYCATKNINKIAVTLMGRIQELLRFRRIGSQVYDLPDLKTKPDIPDEFYTLVRNYADIFHECIHGANPSRLLGNASFRCERGFPSFKNGEQVFVSHRNIDKRHIEPNGFVPVKLMYNDKKATVAYHGLYKPSVDAPIHLLLYHFYHNMKYMIHSHTYIQDALCTTQRIPCGAIEEFYEIIKIYPNREHTFIILNLLGHGSLVMSDRIEKLNFIKYYPRPMPEIVL